MLTVFVVDDEPLVRDFYAREFPWNAIGLRWIGDAPDGETAIERCRSLRPDLVMVDITMPGMNGLSLVERLQTEVPRAYTVLLTCHNDVQLVQRAMRLGALDYIIKAMTTPQETLEKLRDVVARIHWNRRRVGLRDEQRSWLNRLLSGDTGDDLTTSVRDLRLSLDAAPIRVLSIHVDQVEAEPAEHHGDTLRLTLSLEHALDALADSIGSCAWTSPSAGRYALIASGALAARNASSDFITRAHATAHEALGSEIPIQTGASGIHDSIRDAHDAYVEAERAVASCFYFDFSGPLSRCDPWIELTPEIEAQLEAVVADGRSASGDLAERYHAILRRILAKCRELWIDPTAARLFVARVLSDFAARLDHSLSAWDRSLWPLQAERKRTVAELLEWSREIIGALLVSSGHAGLRPEIQRVADDISERLSEPYDLSTAAEKAGMHPNYFSSVFARETGHGFAEYINRLRVGRAAEYIEEGVWKMHQIAEMVGIPNYRTFYNTFRRIMGTGPTEFAERVRASIGGAGGVSTKLWKEAAHDVSHKRVVGGSGPG